MFLKQYELNNLKEISFKNLPVDTGKFLLIRVGEGTEEVPYAVGVHSANGAYLGFVRNGYDAKNATVVTHKEMSDEELENISQAISVA